MDLVCFEPERDESVPGERAARPDWRLGLPALAGQRVGVREVLAADAPMLVSLLTQPEVARFIARPPSTVAEFEAFVSGSTRLRAAGAAACFAVVPRGSESPIGLIQVRGLESGSLTAEWGFALGSPFWGTGVFVEAAALVLDFVFDEAGAHRVEGRAALKNGRGGKALQKLGAVQEGILRKAALLNGEYLDQVLYAIVADDWRQQRSARIAASHIH